jgi:hypothetical protein
MRNSVRDLIHRSVLSAYLGYSPERIEALERQGVLHTARRADEKMSAS